jgi:putative chitinase
MITLQILQAICKTAAGRAAVAQYLEPLNRHMPRYGIDSPARVAMFLAQIAHESQDFTRVSENLNYSAQGLANTWPGRYAAVGSRTPNALAMRLQRNPEAIANNVYSNRMGNGDEASGDGWRYRGKGLKQLTGKHNHRACGEAIGVDLIKRPELLLGPEYAVESACWFWEANNLGPLADRGDLGAVTRKINGGLIGLDDRRIYLLRAVDAIGSGL